MQRTTWITFAMFVCALSHVPTSFARTGLAPQVPAAHPQLYRVFDSANGTAVFFDRVTIGRVAQEVAAWILVVPKTDITSDQGPMRASWTRVVMDCSAGAVRSDRQINLGPKLTPIFSGLPGDDAWRPAATQTDQLALRDACAATKPQLVSPAMGLAAAVKSARCSNERSCDLDAHP